MLNSCLRERRVNFGNSMHWQRRAAGILPDHLFTRRTIDTVEDVVGWKGRIGMSAHQLVR